VDSGGPAPWDFVRGGYLLGSSPVPGAKPGRRDLGCGSAGTVLQGVVRDFQGANF